MPLFECLQHASLLDCLRQSPVDSESMARTLWLIIALPLAGAFTCGVFGRLLGRANTNLIACSAVGGSFVISLLAFWAVNDRAATLVSPFARDPIHYALGRDFGTWFAAGMFRVHFGLTIDHLSGVMILVVTGVGFLIHVYSTSYMAHDEGYWRYFAYLNLFVGMMLTLVLADSLPLLFVGWEGVGLCSYLLIGFWYEDAAKAWAGRKAFIVNRIGDFGFLIGMFLLALWVGAFQVQTDNPSGQGQALAQWRTGVSQQGPLSFRGLEEAVRRIPPAAAKMRSAVSLDTAIESGPLAGATFGQVLAAVLLLFMLGAAGKSAQLPLYVWLPDAMAGPTPVSALIHAATMVTAGVYLFSRIGFLLVLQPPAMAVVAIVGAATALFAGVVAFAQDDIKKVLAYSTISQLGFMFMGVGLGVFWAAILHLVTHAFFKACLFLGAGSVMHGNAGETNIKRLGGLRRQMPWTWATFAVATLAITGIVPLSGFFSKDAILHGVHGSNLSGYEWVSSTVWLVGVGAAFCTAFYMVRLYLLVFEGERSPNAPTPRAHESEWPMTLPLVVLALLSVLGAVYGIPLITSGSAAPGQTLMENYLSTVFNVPQQLARIHRTISLGHEGSLYAAWALAWLIAVAGGALAGALYLWYFPSRRGAPAPAVARAIARWAHNGFYVDQLYDYLIVRPTKFISFVLYKVVDSLLIDTLLVRGTAWVTSRAGEAMRYLQSGDAQSYAAVMALALLCAAGYALTQVLR
jgi:NADH-quinone oxidoreductase subunit L